MANEDRGAPGQTFGGGPMRRAAGLATAMIAMGTIAMAAASGPGFTVRGRVLDDAGKPIAGARVSWAIDWRVQTKIPDATTDADGRFVLEHIIDNPVHLTVEAPGHAPDLKTVPARPGMGPLEFRLGPGHTIRGRIIDAHGKPIAGAPIAVGDWRGNQSLKWSTRTDAEGRFRWDGAPPDRVMIDLGQLGFKGKRFYGAMPDAPEWTMTMRRPLRVRGRVTDAATGRPIKAFRLVPGGTSENSPYIWWDYDEEREIKGLSYDVSLSTTRPLRAIRIEAAGYLPADSRRIRDDEEEAIVHFALKRGEGIAGVVRLPDGSPLVGTEVMLGTVARPIALNNGRIDHKYTADQWIVRTRADGRFNLPPQDPPYTILVLDDRGYALREVADRPSGPVELTARPWGRVEGVLRLGSRPGNDQPLSLQPARGTSSRESISWFAATGTDAEGRFTFDRLLPGKARISRDILWKDQGIASSGGSPATSLVIQPGTTHLTLGGTGRPIVGKAIMPDEVDRRGPWIFGECYLSRKPIHAKSSSYVFKVEPDGTFRIPDIEAGTYEILIVAEKRPEGGGGFFGGKSLASARMEVVVPSIPGGRSDEPMDLGTIRLEATKP